MKKACAYLRVSDERQDEYSPDSQLKLIKEYAERNGYEIPDEYVFYDDGISGRSDEKRFAFQNMIGFVKEHHDSVDAIIVWKFSRFMRNQEKSIVYKAMLKRIGVSVISVSESVDDSSPFSPLIERIIEFMDEYYSTRLAQEVKRGMTEKVSRGEPITIAPFGYKLVDKEYIIDEEKAPYVQYCFDAFNNGEKIRRIAAHLQDCGILTRRGNPPDYRFVEYILNNPVYIGKIRWAKNGRASSSRYHNDNIEVMIVDGKHQPIIELDTWNVTQEKIKQQKKLYGRYQRRDQPISFMLKGLLRCDNCGATLVHTSYKEPSVQCHNYNRGTCKVSHYLSLNKANELVLQALKEACQLLSFNVTKKAEITPLVVNYESLIAKEQERLERLSDAYLNGVENLESYARKKKAIESKISELKKEQAYQPEVEKVDLLNYADKVFPVIDFLESNASEKAKNEALRTIIDHIDYEKEQQSLHLYFYE